MLKLRQIQRPANERGGIRNSTVAIVASQNQGLQRQGIESPAVWLRLVDIESNHQLISIRDSKLAERERTIVRPSDGISELNILSPIETDAARLARMALKIENTKRWN